MTSSETLPAPADLAAAVDASLTLANAIYLLGDAYAQIATLEAKLAKATKEEQRVYELIGRVVADIGDVLAGGTFRHKSSDGVDVEHALTDIADKLADGRVGL